MGVILLLPRKHVAGLAVSARMPERVAMIVGLILTCGIHRAECLRRVEVA